MLNAAQKSAEAFRTISEVAVELEVPQHVLRFWETRFAAVKPLKRGGGRRYYRPEDVDLLRGIRTLLYTDGLTIKGAQKILREQGARYVSDLGRGAVRLLERPRANAARPDALGLARASNVHPFRREAAEPKEDASDEARFKRLLDELLDLKGQLQSVKR